jgi:hypothetical protein
VWPEFLNGKKRLSGRERLKKPSFAARTLKTALWGGLFWSAKHFMDAR